MTSAVMSREVHQATLSAGIRRATCAGGWSGGYGSLAHASRATPATAVADVTSLVAVAGETGVSARLTGCAAGAGHEDAGRRMRVDAPQRAAAVPVNWVDATNPAGEPTPSNQATPKRAAGMKGRCPPCPSG